MRVLWVSLAILVVDQLTKAWVAATMFPGQSIPLVGSVLKLTYTTNPGMAFGMEVGPKLFLTLFSIVATAAITGYLWAVRTAPWGYRLALAAVIGGALGNVIDRTFYGVIYGYAPLFYGEVVDFIHVNLFYGTVNVPVLGPTFLPLFPIWNVADMAIVLGVAAIIVGQRHFHRQMAAEEQARRAEPAPAAAPLAEPPPPAAPLPADPP